MGYLCGLAALLCMLLVSGRSVPASASASEQERAAAPASGGFPVRVMSFNVRHGRANDGDDHWSKRKQLVLRAIRAHGADLIGLQECLPFQARFLEQGLPAHEAYVISRAGEGKDDEACAILWRAERFRCLERGTFWLSPEPDEIAKAWDAALPRTCSWVRLRDRSSGREFVFANTHFDHRGRRARLESARQLAGMWPDEELVLAGDFNSAEDSAPMRVLFDSGFRDTFRELHPEATEVGTFSGFRELNATKIDAVLVRGEARVLAAAIDQRRLEGRWPSDHCPVVAALTWAP